MMGEVLFLTLEGLRSFLQQIYEMARLAAKTLVRMPLFFKNVNISVAQMYGIGITSLPLVTVIALFTGSVTVTQAVYQFAGFVPLRYLGMVVSKSIVTELAPVLTSLVVSGRITTAIAAEIGSMKGSEQLDAMTILRLDPIRYLIVPKTLACLIMLPMLVIWAEFLAYLGSVVTVVLTVDMTLFSYLNGLRMFFNPTDVYVGIGKTAVFGGIISLVGSHFGFRARGGAEGVGHATTKAVMLSSVLILIFDFIIAFLFLR
jgi:phospholipid/cholesterol/gamma-HCH transport system permease protein